MESPGPSGGFVTRPSSEQYPANVLLVLDDPSPFGLYIVASQARQLLEQDVDAVSVLVLSQPSGTEAARELERVAGIVVHWGASLRVSDNDGLVGVSFEDLVDRTLVTDDYELVVLCVDVGPPDGLDELARSAGVALAGSGYLQVNGGGIESTTPGIFVAGCGSGPKTIGQSVDEARSAAAAGLLQLNPILLDGHGRPEGGSEKPTPGDDMRVQLEKLLYALIDTSKKG